MPSPTQPFIGRARDLDALLEMLHQPDCRLITLVGVGGSGKTRLAQALAAQIGAVLKEGCTFVPLQIVSAAHLLPDAIADALGIKLTSDELPVDRIQRSLHGKHLLMLDNYEHLLPDVEFIVELLNAAPGLRLLVTSREMLKLRDEWVYPVEGLDFPDGLAVTADWQAYSAIELFLQFMQPLRRGAVSESELRAIARICRMVEGMPLALELAASWTRTLPPDIIAAEIETNLDFLSTTLRDFPTRHQSVRAVFNQSWQHLTDQERLIFSRLSVLEGSFDRRAAEDVAGASLYILSSLVEKSLVRITPDQRYQFHPLLRQYAAEKLATEYEAEPVRAAHARHFAALMSQRQLELFSHRQREANLAIRRDFENIMAAWQWAAVRAEYKLLRNIVGAMGRYSNTQGRYRELGAALIFAIERLTAEPPSPECQAILALLQSLLGWNCIRLGRYADSQVAFERSQSLLMSLAAPPELIPGSDPHLGFSMLTILQGRYADARQQAEDTIEGALQRQDWLNLEIAHYLGSSAAYGQRDYAGAASHAAQTRAIAERIGDQWMLAGVFFQLGNLARIHNDSAQARHHYQMGYDIRYALDDQEGMSTFLVELGRLDLLEGDFQAAEQRFQECLRVCQGLGDLGGVAVSYGGLGEALLAQGDLKASREHFLQAFDILIETGWAQTLLLVLIGTADWILHNGDPGVAARILDDVLMQTGLEPFARQHAERLRQGIAHQPAALLDASPENLLAFSRMVQGLLRESNIQDSLPVPSLPQDVLIEPLSAREIEILRLLGDGLSNQEIARKLVVAVGTVKAHNHNIFNKLGVDNRTRAIMRARQLGLI